MGAMVMRLLVRRLNCVDECVSRTDAAFNLRSFEMNGLMQIGGNKDDGIKD